MQTDSSQLALIRHLDGMKTAIEGEHSLWKTFMEQEKQEYMALEAQRKEQQERYTREQRANGNMYMKLFGSQSAEPVLQREVSSLGQQMKPLKGLYIFGSPGCGKTFTMDLFFESLGIEEKKRVHFNEFMLDIHRQMHAAKLDNRDDPLESVAMQQSFRQRLLCLDEF